MPRRTDRGGRTGAIRDANGVILCPCGDRLADRIDGDTVIIDGAEFQFRRRNDAITCRTCGVSHPVRVFRASSEPSDTGQRRRADD